MERYNFGESDSVISYEIKVSKRGKSDEVGMKTLKKGVEWLNTREMILREKYTKWRGGYQLSREGQGFVDKLESVHGWEFGGES